MIINIIDLNYYIGFSFSNGIRTFVGNLFGKKQFKESKILNDKLLLVAIISSSFRRDYDKFIFRTNCKLIYKE